MNIGHIGVEMLSIEDQIKQLTIKQENRLEGLLKEEKKLEEAEEKKALEKMKKMLPQENESLRGLRKSSLESFDLFCKSEMELIHMECKKHRSEVDQISKKNGKEKKKNI